MRLRVGLLVVALVAAALLVDLWPSGQPGRPDDRGTLSAGEEGQPRQTSDGEAGEIAEPLSAYARAMRPQIDNRRSWRMAPGVTFRRWDRTDARGQVRAHLVTIDPSVPGVSIDYGRTGRHVPDRDTVTGMLRREGRAAVAAVNGGFFDISDTGAPLGVGQDRQRGFLHAARHTWNNAFWVRRGGRAGIGKALLEAKVVEHPQLEISNLNSPRARAGGIGVWNGRWGSTSGYAITDGQRRGVRMVVVEGGRVVANTTDLSSGKDIDGPVLVGRGPGAEQLKQLRVGSTATVRWKLERQPAVAISGESILLDRGRIRVSDDRILHPRTAVGIDRQTGRILLLVVDGRQSHSRGYTLVELARMMKQLGAEAALNLDGGGSSAIAGLTRQDSLRVLNQPSDGGQREVADGIVVRYTAP